MAKQVSVSMVDDFDGTSTADTTITYSIDGTHYEIDLSNKNADKFHAAIATWIDHSRKVSAPEGSRRPRKISGGEDFTAIRQWAASQGMTVSPRGRIKSEIVTAYHSRNSVPAKPDEAVSTVKSRAASKKVAAAIASVVPVDAPEFSAAK
jgi:hypothetical protein